MEITPGNVMFVVAVLLFFSVLIGKVGSKYHIVFRRIGYRLPSNTSSACAWDCACYCRCIDYYSNYRMLYP